MAVHPSAGRPAPADQLVDVAELLDDYFDQSPDAADPAERVSFGTSGHRGLYAESFLGLVHLRRIQHEARAIVAAALAGAMR